MSQKNVGADGFFAEQFSGMTFEVFHHDARLDVAVPVVRKDHRLFPIFCPRPTVRILFYTDSAAVDFNSAQDFGVDLLRDLILSRNTFYVNFQIDLVNRHRPTHAANKLTSSLLSRYDQVWFFGVLQCNLPDQPENELTNPEVAALSRWMAQGGVLMTGDHANPKPPAAAAGLDPLLNLGRAIGHRVPRAGELRKWEGTPSAVPAQSHNTQEPDGLNSLDNLTLQDDALPQRLLLKQYPLGWHFPRWIRRSRPHPLFCGRLGPIRVFPDHMHEGELLIPSAFPAPTWPAGPVTQPLPEIVARGTDKRTGSVYGVTTAYDGAAANVGRIVADATWHHYFNVNLRGFPPGTTLNEIADYYVNLAVWLSPTPKRAAMRCHLWWWLALHPAVFMVAHNPIFVLGETAYNVLGKVASQCMISEWIFPPHLIEWPLRERFPWPPEELVLGGIVEQYHSAIRAAQAGEKLPEVGALYARGVRSGLHFYTEELAETLKGAQALDEITERLLAAGDQAAGPETDPA
ncbi:hypothetical protein [Deinococcus budaensis]|uniref:Uncharacterized protein n=1 Tax=Deinococcus budaensis TaxID=1665626 RepID=A0A7W8GIE0_9DEIO|nr:hypothetical protein [Deinococcus budaensis]MBB5235889.1 hypothetical protein [Deinococcus budaensis]